MTDATEACYLGVDGGGSKVLAVIVNAQGEMLGRGYAGSANYNTVGLERAIEQIQIAVGEAARAAGCQLPVKKAWLGLAGIDRQADHDLILPHLHNLAEVVHLSNDAELLLAGLEQQSGVVLISGTGSIALGRETSGKSARAGGWGHILGDEGSGYAISQQALQAAVRASDGRGPQTLLLENILSHWDLQSAEDIIGIVYSEIEKAQIASLSTCVFLAARAGDQVATGIIQHAASELALAAFAVCKTLQIPSAQEINLALGGGLLLNETDFCKQVIQQLRSHQSIGQVVLVSNPTLSAARAAIHLEQR